METNHERIVKIARRIKSAWDMSGIPLLLDPSNSAIVSGIAQEIVELEDRISEIERQVYELQKRSE